MKMFQTSINVGYGVFTAVAMKNAVIWDVAPWVYYKPMFQKNVLPPSSG
jgi:hypothetical protein